MLGRKSRPLGGARIESLTLGNNNMKTNATNAGETGTRSNQSFTRHFPTVARILMGLPLFIFGLNAFFNFIPQPTTPLPEGAAAFAGALMKTGYMMQLIGVTQL